MSSSFAYKTLCSLGPIVVATLIAVVSLSLVAIKENQYFEEFALGNSTSSVFAVREGVPIHCGEIKDPDPCILGYAKHGNGREVVLWLGNSQLHGVNQYKDGELNVIGYLASEISDSDYLLAFSQPNVNLQEQYALFEYLLQKLPVAKLILPVVFDDMREDGVRGDFDVVLGDRATLDALLSTPIGEEIISEYQLTIEAANDIGALTATVQETTESSINGWLDRNLNIWSARPDIRGNIFLDLFFLRNAVFNIDASSKRKIIKNRYSKNMKALKAILQSASVNSIDVVLYIVPIRNDVEIPYDLVEYEGFKTDIQDLSKSTNVQFTNFENIVSAEYWGSKASTDLSGKQELDFMHFQSLGHRILAEAIAEQINAE